MQPPIVIMPVGEVDQRLVTAAVMPTEHLLRQARCDRLVEDALKLDDVVVIDACGLRLGTREEPGRRQLARIADDHHLLAAGDGTDGVVGADLRGFVEHHQIEATPVGRQVLRDGQRAHQHTRLQPGEQVGDLP